MLKIKEVKLFNIFDNIEYVKGRNEKLRLLSQANDKQKDLLELACNPYKQFHITKWSKEYKKVADFSDEDIYRLFKDLIEYALKTNRCSELENLTSVFFANCNEQQRKWCERILTKELRLGILAKSINKVFNNLIPTFEVMLAEKANKDLSNVNFSKGVWAEYKYDGFRIIGQYGDTLDVIGRSGKEIVNKEFYNKLFEFKKELDGKLIDGEGYSHSLSFEQISSILRTEDAGLEDIKFILFDTIDLIQWKEKRVTPKFKQRLEYREEICSKSLFFIQAFGKQVYNAQDVSDFYEQALEQGYEGLILKYMDMPYQYKRSEAMLKLKPEDFADAKIKGFYEGLGRNMGRLGGFIVELEDGIECRIGGGYKDWQRIEYWKNPNQYIGQWIVVKFTEWTAKGKFRHGNFKRFRDSKD